MSNYKGGGVTLAMVGSHALLEGARKANPAKPKTKRKASPAQIAWRKQFAAMAKAGKVGKRSRNAAPARKRPAPATKRATRANPVSVARKSVTRRSLVGGVNYAVLYYHHKTKPTGKPDFVIPARDRSHVRKIIEALKAKDADGLVVIEKTTNKV
jgi:hypothetical protein